MSDTAAASAGLLARLRARLGRRAPDAVDVLPVRVAGTELRGTAATPARVLGFDEALLWMVVLLLAFSVVMV